MRIIYAFKTDKPMKFVEQVGHKIIQEAYGRAGDWLLVLENGRRVFVSDEMYYRLLSE